MRHKVTRLLARLLLIVGVLASFSATAQAAITLTSGDKSPKGITQGATYNSLAYFTATGGQAPYTFSVSNYGGPAAGNWTGGGWVFNSDGTLSGRSCVANGSVTYTVTVTDFNGQTAIINAQNNVGAAPAKICATVTMNSSGPVTGIVGTAITPQTNVPTGGTGPYTFTASGLPPGLTIDPATGTVTGTPTGPTGNGAYTVTAKDFNGNTVTNTINYSIGPGTQAQLNLTASPSTIPQTSASNLSVTGGSGSGAVTYAVTAGSCQINGTDPNATVTYTGPALVNPATAACTVTATKAAADGYSVATSNAVTVTFNDTTAVPQTPALTIAPSPATITTAQTSTVSVTSGSGPGTTGVVTWSASGPCTVTRIDPSPYTSATVTPTGGAGTCIVTADRASPDPAAYLPATAQTQVTITAAADALVLIPPAGALPPAEIGLPYAFVFTSTGGLGPKTYSLASGTLPAGMSLDPATGRLSGTPTTAGPYNFRICVDDTDPTTVQDCKNYSLTVANGFGITTNSLPAPTLGSNYDQPVAVQNALGAVTYAITAGALPAGLSLNQTTGVISGNTQASGCYNFTVTATDSGRFSPFNTSSKAYSFCVTRPDPSKDVNVRGIISSQARAAYRFVRGQIALIQSHLDHLHDDDDSGDGCSDPDRPGAVRDFCVEYDNKVQIRGAQRTLSGQEQDVQNLRRLNDVNALADPTGVATQNRDAQRLTQNQIEKQSKVASVDPMINTTNNTQDSHLGAADPNMRNFSALAIERSSNYPARTAGQAPEIVGPTPRIKGGVKVNVWTAGEVDFGRYDNQGRLLNEKFNVGSLAVGADMRVMPGLRAGVAFGYGNDYATINYGLARSEAQNFSATGYASYKIAPGIFVDGLFGYGDLHYFSNRLGGDNTWISGNRNGYALFQSLALTVEKRYGGLKIAPYVRVDGGQVYLNSYTEMGSREWALSYNGANTNTVDAVGGVRASYDYKLNSGGVITPNVRAQFQKFFTSSVSQWMNYAIDPSMSYNYFDMGQLQWLFMGTIGAQYTLDNVSAGVDFVTTTSGARYQTNGVRANIRVSF